MYSISSQIDPNSHHSLVSSGYNTDVNILHYYKVDFITLIPYNVKSLQNPFNSMNLDLSHIYYVVSGNLNGLFKYS